MLSAHHQAGSADREEGVGVALESTEQVKVLAEAKDDVGDRVEIGGGVLEADQVRLATMRALVREGESSFATLQKKTGLDLSPSTFSYHQRVLHEAGLVQVRVDGSRRFLSIRADDLEDRFPGLLGAVLDTRAVA
jgi:DNA-binding transcriptional ArsR family regulator